jgi:hypothetical protein
LGERQTPWRETVEFHGCEGGAFVAQASHAGMSSGFAFIDHSHRYEHVASVVKGLSQLPSPGAFVPFHDFNHPRNPFETRPDFGVYQAVADLADAHNLEFWGIYGCCGLYRSIPTAA